MRLHSNGRLFPAIGGIATTVRSSFRLKSVSNPRKAAKVPFILRNPMNNDTPSLFFVFSTTFLTHTARDSERSGYGSQDRD